jgi:hypothetical protein
MIDATASLLAAEQISAATLIDYLRATGWSSRPSRVEGIAIFSKLLPGADNPVQFILPVEPGVDEEQRRIADALRTLAQIERRSEAQIAERVQQSPNRKKLISDGALSSSRRGNSGTTSPVAIDRGNVVKISDFLANKSLTDETIESAAQHLRKSFGFTDQDVFNIVELLETKMPTAVNHFELVKPARKNISEVYSTTVPPRIYAPERVRRLASEGDAKSRFVLAHEMAHLLLYVSSPSFRAPKSLESARNAELQASKFAMALLIPSSIAHQFSDSGRLSLHCKVERKVAELRMAYLGLMRNPKRSDVIRKFERLVSQVTAQQKD